MTICAFTVKLIIVQNRGATVIPLQNIHLSQLISSVEAEVKVKISLWSNHQCRFTCLPQSVSQQRFPARFFRRQHAHSLSHRWISGTLRRVSDRSSSPEKKRRGSQLCFCQMGLRWAGWQPSKRPGRNCRAPRRAHPWKLSGKLSPVHHQENKGTKDFSITT